MRENGKRFRQRLTCAVRAAAQEVGEMAEDIAGNTPLITGLEIRIRIDCSSDIITPDIEIRRTHFSKRALDELVKRSDTEG